VKDADGLRDAFTNLSQVPPCPLLSRAEWVAKFRQIRLREIVIDTPGVEADTLDARWSVTRIGSFWFRDEECHVYAMDTAIEVMVQNRSQMPGSDLAVVSPVWVFYRSGDAAKIVNNPDALAIANRNFMRFFNDEYKKRKGNG